MQSEEATERLIGALRPYFSAPIAKALLAVTFRRVNVEPVDVDFQKIPNVVVALERALPSYIADEERRAECVNGLRRLLALAAAPPPQPVALQSQPKLAAVDEASSASTVVRIQTADDVTNACEVGRDIARRVGFSHVDQTKIATAISELGRNIILYAETGEVRIASLSSPRRGIHITAVDQGPGIPDMSAVMSNSYRSRTGMGMGLKGTKRLMDMFELASSPGVGTTVVARKFLS